MTTLKHIRLPPSLALAARTAADLMTPNPVSIRQVVTVAEAASFLAARGISAAPVIDEAGRPVGVVSSTDILVHKGQGTVNLMRSPEYHERLGQPVFSEDGSLDGASRQPEVSDVMTPAVFCVRLDTPAAKVVEKMLALKVRRLFVVDGDGVLVGVISALDVLRRLRLWAASTGGNAGT